MKLFLDDLRPCPDDHHLCLTVEEAKAWLRRGIVTHISFDHDLGDSYWGHPDPPTGYDLAKWIETHADQIPRLTWAVHSANPVGAQNIRMAMWNATRYWESAETS